MATLDIPAITIPDAQLADVQAALRQRYASNGIPNPTNAQVIEAMRQEIIANIRGVTLAYKQAQANAGVAAPDPS